MGVTLQLRGWLCVGQGPVWSVVLPAAAWWGVARRFVLRCAVQVSLSPFVLPPAVPFSFGRVFVVGVCVCVCGFTLPCSVGSHVCRALCWLAGPVLRSVNLLVGGRS